LNTDYVIVGAGTAGCLVAARLAEDPGVDVTLIEAGPKNRNLWFRIPAGYGRLFQMGGFHWRFNTQSEPELNGRSLAWPRGRVLGGSGEVNGLVFLRGAAADYDRWALACGPQWSYGSVLPYFRKLERWAGSAGPTRGADGPIRVREQPTLSNGARAFIAAANALGLPTNPDMNSGEIYGVAPTQMNVGRAFRSSTARAYLEPAMAKSNLRVITGATVTRIVFERKRAVGVTLRRDDGTALRVDARRRVVLCAGAIGSPQLLLASGIGPARDLCELGIPRVADSPGVGANLQDHFVTRFTFATKPAGTLNEIMANPVRTAMMGLQYLLAQSGPLNRSVTEATLFARTPHADDEPDVQFHFTNFHIDAASYRLPYEPGFMFSFNQCRPRSRGIIRLASSNMLDAPLIQPGYLSHPADRAVALGGARLGQRIRWTAPFADLITRSNFPDDVSCPDDELLDFIRANGTTVYHPGGTCRMGIDAHAVVDARLAVRGVDALSVVDASVMPCLPSSNPQAATMMIAERWLDLLKDRFE
jgi:choline dehydrogenase